MKYWKAINVIEARERLVDMNIADYPKMKNEGRKKFYRQMRKQAYPIHLQKTMDFEEFGKRLEAMNG